MLLTMLEDSKDKIILVQAENNQEMENARDGGCNLIIREIMRCIQVNRQGLCITEQENVEQGSDFTGEAKGRE